MSWIGRAYFSEKTRTKTSLTSYVQMRALELSTRKYLGGQVTHVPVVRRLIDFRQLSQSYMGPVGLGLALSSIISILGAKINARPYSEPARDLGRMP